MTYSSFESTYPCGGDFWSIVKFLHQFQANGIFDTELAKKVLSKSTTIEGSTLANTLSKSNVDNVRRKLTVLKNTCLALDLLGKDGITEAGYKLITNNSLLVFKQQLLKLPTAQAVLADLEKHVTCSVDYLFNTVSLVVRDKFENTSPKTVEKHFSWLIRTLQYLQIVHTDGKNVTCSQGQIDKFLRQQK